MINLRDPYFVIYQVAAETTLTQVDIDIYIHTGAQSSTTTGAQYSLSSSAITPSSGSPYVTFDISELARDYIDTTFDGSYACDVVWVNYQLTTYIADVAQTPKSVVQLTGFDGYGYFEEGVQSATHNHTSNAPTENTTQSDLLQSNTVIYKNDDDVVRVPILQDNITDVYFLYCGEIVNEETITAAPTTSTSVIRYVSNTGASYDTFKARVEADSGTLEDGALDGVFNRYSTQPCDTVILETSSSSTKLIVKDIEECKYTPYKLTFINKFGAKQDLWFFKKSKLSLATQKDMYQANTLSIGTYSINSHRDRVLSKNGKEMLMMNSGWYPEDYNEVFRQLMLSELVWIDYENNILPVNVSNSNFEFKTSVNDKLINNNITVEFAFNKINDIR